MRKQFRYITDAGHGWIEVHRDDLAELGLAEVDFSEFSYKNAGHLYLEEDCDATTFIGIYESLFGKSPIISEHHDGNWSRIRSFARIEGSNFNWNKKDAT